MGLKKMIREIVPYEWEHILKQNRCFCRYIDLVYATHCSGRITPELTKMRIKRIKEAMLEDNPTDNSSSFWYSANFIRLCATDEYKFFASLNSKIQNYKRSCK